MDPTTLIQSVQQAALAASQAAQALREANEKRGSGYAEANKIIQCPKEFGHATTLEDQSQWSDFAFSFKSWLFFAEPAFEVDIQYVEDHPSIPVTYQDNPSGAASKEHSRKLYSILAGILKQRPLKTLRQVGDANGLEVWRQLHGLYMPKTKGRALALLNALMGMPAFTKERTCLEQIQNMERLSEEYRKASGQEINDDILLSTLIRVLPRHIQQHIQLSMDEQSSFAQVKDRVLAYERVSSTWTKDRVLADAGIAPLGAVSSYANDGGASAPMEINMIKGKGKWKGKQQSDKGKSKGKSGFDKGKPKGKQFDKGKGKSSSKGAGDSSKGSQKGQSGAKLDSNVCAYCGKYGHWQRDCLKKKSDQQNKQVRVVEDVGDSKTDTTYSSATASTAAASVRMVSIADTSHAHGLVEDLTVFSLPSSSSSPFQLCMISSCDQFDMSSTDSDMNWTISPDLTLLETCCSDDSICSCIHGHVRVVSNVAAHQSSMPCDVILDSGADTSALPLRFSGVGTACPSPNTTFVDAQGSPLAVESTRLATVQFGDVIFREKFIVADVTTPLIALGHIIRSGWSLVQQEHGPCLMKDGHCINVLYRNNSLGARGSISMICEVEPEESIQAIRVVQPGIVPRTLAAGWNRLNPQMFAIKTTAPKHVDTTVVPSDELMWLRTTLVCREGSGWEVDEFCEAIADLHEGLEAEFHFPSSVLEVITIAHKYAMPAQNMGFYMPDYGLNVEGQSANVAQSVGDGENVGESQADVASEGYEQSILADLPEEAPVDCDEGEPLAEDRVVLRGPDEATVYIDGVALTLDSTLRALRAGCESLGLSKRGSKQTCMKRMLDHVQTQTLLAAHSAEVRLKAEAEREVRGQKIPSVPTQVEIDNHNLTHEPFKEWCEVCTMYRARQDKHVASDHSHSGHSVLSYDFGYCSRMPGGADKLTCLVLKDRDTQLVHVVPTLQKGGKSLQYLVTEFVRFIMHTGHRELALRSDLEPSNLAILDAVRKTCRGLGITVHHEPVPVGSHESNGAAEATLQHIRLRAGMWVQQIENQCAGGKTIFPCSHPLFAWALLHACWVYNRFVVTAGSTAFERSTDRMYTGKLAMLVSACWAF